jgi:hypothetical protein
VRLTGGDGSLESGGLIGQRPFIWCRVDLEGAEIKINQDNEDYKSEEAEEEGHDTDAN